MGFHENTGNLENIFMMGQVLHDIQGADGGLPSLRFVAAGA